MLKQYTIKKPSTTNTDATPYSSISIELSPSWSTSIPSVSLYTHPCCVSPRVHRSPMAPAPYCTIKIRNAISMARNRIPFTICLCNIFPNPRMRKESLVFKSPSRNAFFKKENTLLFFPFLLFFILFPLYICSQRFLSVILLIQTEYFLPWYPGFPAYYLW